MPNFNTGGSCIAISYFLPFYKSCLIPPKYWQYKEWLPRAEDIWLIWGLRLWTSALSEDVQELLLQGKSVIDNLISCRASLPTNPSTALCCTKNQHYYPKRKWASGLIVTKIGKRWKKILLAGSSITKLLN